MNTEPETDREASEQDEALFRGWVKRIELLPVEKDFDYEDASPRMKLIHEIHEDAGERYPLGIAQGLARAIDCLARGEEDADAEAAQLLTMLAEDEVESRRVNP